MAFYETCPLCGANLDPGEPCDCQEEKELEGERLRRIQGMLKAGKDGQLRMDLLLQEVGNVQI